LGHRYFDWARIESDVILLGQKLRTIEGIENYKQLVPIGRGGLVPARLVAKQMNIKRIPDFVPVNNGSIVFVPHMMAPTLFVDDIYDTGKTLEKVRKFGDDNKLYVFLYTRFHTDDRKIVYGQELSMEEKEDYIVFPWENGPED
jgi:hypoxanthine phosphoribosyltransferase